MKPGRTLAFALSSSPCFHFYDEKWPKLLSSFLLHPLHYFLWLHHNVLKFGRFLFELISFSFQFPSPSYHHHACKLYSYTQSPNLLVFSPFFIGYVQDTTALIMSSQDRQEALHWLIFLNFWSRHLLNTQCRKEKVPLGSSKNSLKSFAFHGPCAWPSKLFWQTWATVFFCLHLLQWLVSVSVTMILELRPLTVATVTTRFLLENPRYLYIYTIHIHI